MKKNLVGNVFSINADQITICGYDYGSDEDREDQYFISPRTRFINIQSLDEISRDDQVKITYEEDAGKNLVLSLIWQGDPWGNPTLSRRNFPILQGEGNISL